MYWRKIDKICLENNMYVFLKHTHTYATWMSLYQWIQAVSNGYIQSINKDVTSIWNKRLSSDADYYMDFQHKV